MVNSLAVAEGSTEDVIESLRFENYPIIADKGKGYMITYDIKERLLYYERRKKELKVQFAAIKIKELRDMNGELWTQPQVINEMVEEEMESING